MRRAGHACHPACAPRLLAMRNGEFLWHHLLRGWIVTDIPERRPGVVALMRYAFGKSDTPPVRQPYTFDCCPWCGGDLAPLDDGEGPE